MDQLHGAVAQISSFCFEIKKFCVTTLFVVMTLLVKFTSDKLDHSIFVAGLIIPVCFWFLDATGYFYQVKLRGTMESMRERLVSRDGNSLLSVTGTPVIAPSRLLASAPKRIFKAGFNHSMWLYLLLMLIDGILWTMFIVGYFK